MQKAHDKPVNEDGQHTVVKEMGEYAGWLEKALKTTEMIEALTKERRTKAAKVPAAPKRGRHLNLA